MKKTTVAIFITIITLSLLAGCGGQFGRAEQTPPTSEQTASSVSTSPDPESTSPDAAEQPVTLFLPNAARDGFVTMTALTDGTAAHILSLLVTAQALPEGCALLDFAIDGNGSGHADMNATYGQAVREGTTGEYLRLGAAVNTLLIFYDLEEITLTIEGDTLETGHEIYDYPLRFFVNQTADLGGAETTPSPEPPPAAPEPAPEADGLTGAEWNDLSGAIGGLPRSDAVDNIWHRLYGYWTAADNLFVGFVYRDGIPCVTYGVWETEGRGFGEFAGGVPMGDYEAALTVRFPATEANEIYDARPESMVTVFIEVSGLDNDGKINIKIKSHGDGEYYTYAYGGATSEEAYRSVHP
ncbi:MAG: hypothetical protein LBQ16_02640 [Gracilibacteraceae bacterium]|jgi:hypothetical protein|nr:hypothetical protein [Gracilibacteraceae bacterium]